MDQKGSSVDAPPPYSAAGGQPMPQQGYYEPQGGVNPQMQQQYATGYPPMGYAQPPIHVSTAAGPGGMPAQVTVVTVAPQYGPHPMNLTCPNCGANVVTATRTEAGLLTWLLCGACVLVGCWLGCCFIPFCIPECQDVAHSCPNCKAFLGTSRRL